MGEVVDLPVITKLDIPPAKILLKAAEHGLQDVVLAGWDKNGEFYFAGSMPDGPTALWLLETAKNQLMEVNNGD